MVAKFISTSQAANTGAHSTATITFSVNEITIGFWWKVNTVNNLNTVWASDSGQFQIFNGASNAANRRKLFFRANGFNTVSVDPGAVQVGNWCWFVFRAGLNHLGSDDISAEVWDDAGNQIGTTVSTTSTISSELTSAGRHWFMGDDNSGGANTDDGFEGETAGLIVCEGIISNADMPYNTTTGELQTTLSSAASAAVVYHLLGTNASDRLEDNSGTGNDFSNEGLTFSETDLPPIEVSSGAQAITGAVYVDTDAFGAGTVSPGPVSIVGSTYTDADAFGAGTISQTGPDQSITGATFTDADTFGAGVVNPGAVIVSGATYTDSDSFGAGSIQVGAVNITGSTFDDPDVFYSGTVSQDGSSPQNITGSTYEDPDSFPSGTISTGPVSIAGSTHVDTDSFGAGAIRLTISGGTLSDPDSFGAGVVSVGPVSITGSTFVDADTFYNGIVTGGEQVANTNHRHGIGLYIGLGF